jgi:hypothetical protein
MRWIKLNSLIINLDEVNYVKKQKNANGIIIFFKNDGCECINDMDLNDFFLLINKHNEQI